MKSKLSKNFKLRYKKSNRKSHPAVPFQRAVDKMISKIWGSNNAVRTIDIIVPKTLDWKTLDGYEFTSFIVSASTGYHAAFLSTADNNMAVHELGWDLDGAINTLKNIFVNVFGYNDPEILNMIDAGHANMLKNINATH